MSRVGRACRSYTEPRPRLRSAPSPRRCEPGDGRTPFSNPRAATGSLLPDSFPSRIFRWLHHIHPIHRHHTAPTHLQNRPITTTSPPPPLSFPVKDCEGCPARAGVRTLEADDPSGGRPALHCNFCESDHPIEPAPRRLLPRRVRRPRRGRRHRGRVRTPQSISSRCSRCSTTRRWRRSSRGRTR